MAHVKTECNYGEGIQLRAGQDAPPTVSVAHFLNMSQHNYKHLETAEVAICLCSTNN